jgi:hypothetical protein
MFQCSKPSISELQRETDRWPTCWRAALGEEGEWQGFWWTRGKDDLEDRVSTDADEDYAKELAARFADLANTAPLLLEIAAAALACQNSECTGKRCSHPAHRSPCAILATQDALEAALSKVRP